MKEWKCVLVGHHDNVGKAIEKWQEMVWRLHTYACDGNAAVALGTNRYLLFERDWSALPVFLYDILRY